MFYTTKILSTVFTANFMIKHDYSFLVMCLNNRYAISWNFQQLEISYFESFARDQSLHYCAAYNLLQMNIFDLQIIFMY